MGGAASTEAKQAVKAVNNAELHPDVLKTARTKKHVKSTSENKFVVADRSSLAMFGLKEFDVDQVKLDILSSLTGVSTVDETGKNYPEGLLEQITQCKLLAATCSGRDDVISKIVTFVTTHGAKSEGGVEIMLLTGPGGSGVSSTIAKAIVSAGQRLDASNTTLVYRQINSKTSTALLLVASICVQLGLPIPMCQTEIRSSLDSIISCGTDDAPLVAVFDGLNHMQDDSTDAGLEWIVWSLQHNSNPFARFLLSTSPYPSSSVELAICRSLLSCPIVALPSLSVQEARALLERECASPLDTDTVAKFETSFDLAVGEDGISPCYVKLLTTGILKPFLSKKEGYEVLPNPIPATPQEAFEKLLILLENHFPQEGQEEKKHTNPPINTRPIKIELDARKLLTIQVLSVLSLARFEDGLSCAEIQQLIPPSPHLLPPSKPALPSVESLLNELMKEFPDLQMHLGPDSKGRWSWKHSVARSVAEYRYHALSKPNDSIGENMPDEPTRFIASAYSDYVAAQRRANTKNVLQTNKYIKDQMRLLCIAQKKNELLTHMLDIRVIVAMSKAWGGISGVLNRMMTYRRHALVERGIFLRRDRMDEFDAIILILERYRRIIDIGIQERKLEIVFKQILKDGVLDCPAASGVLEGFLTKLRKKDDNPRETVTDTGRSKSAATTATQRVSFSLEDKNWVFSSCRDMLVDAIGREPRILVNSSPKPENQVTGFLTSGDGRFVVAQIGPNQIRAFEVAPFKEIWTVVSPYTITATAMSPTGKAFAFAAGDEISIFKTSNGAKQVSISSIFVEAKQPEAVDEADLTPEQIDPPLDLIVAHMQFSNDITLLISSQIGHLITWKINHNWASGQSYKGNDVEKNFNVQKTVDFAVSRDESTCVWWETGSSSTDLGPEHYHSSAKLSIFDLSLDTPSHALIHRLRLDIPTMTAPLQFNTKGDQIIVVECDSLYCINAKSGDLEWSITTSNAGLTGDWANVCFFKDFENNEALVAVTVDGWAVDVTDGYIRWRVFIGLTEGDTVEQAAAMNGHLPSQKYSYGRNQFSVGHHIAYRTKKGGLFVIGLQQLGSGLKYALISPAGSKANFFDSKAGANTKNASQEPADPEVTPVISKIVSTSCDPVSGETIAVDALSVLHISTSQQVKIATTDDAVIYGAIVNSGIVVVTRKNVLSFASFAEGAHKFGESALSGTPKTYAHTTKILNCAVLSVSKSQALTTMLFILDSSNNIVSLSILSNGTPTVSSSLQLEPAVSPTSQDPIATIVPRCDGEAVTLVSRGGRISIVTVAPGTPSRTISGNIFIDSGSGLGIPGIKNPLVLSAALSKDSGFLAVGDSNGGLRFVNMAELESGISGLRVQAAFRSGVVGLKWLTNSEIVGLGEDGTVAVWKVDPTLKKVVLKGLLDCGNSTPTCLDVIEASFNEDDECDSYRVCIGSSDGRINEYILSQE
ncbi:hypothetical protein HDU79_001822 [Rhizoclosmatium sp. JEL0117]|nr:hypothetical protein HDU79_001822 [Rhizoclosmatium sp. JEL0117]